MIKLYEKVSAELPKFENQTRFTSRQREGHAPPFQILSTTISANLVFTNKYILNLVFFAALIFHEVLVLAKF